ncbi:MAG: alpha-amylase/4-alpha-glucanotransferase domain-containing protein [bacterium]
MSKPKFIFGIHCHQPVGNFDHLIEEAYQKAYLPFIQTMIKHPRIKFVAHYSGVLYDWFQAKHPEFIELLQKLTERHQLEIIGGAYYEPILTIIPDQDKLGQIETMSKVIRDTFTEAPQGAWIGERVWENNLAKILAQASIEYTILDDYHFYLAGLPQKKINGCYVTEDEGESVKVFALNDELREMIPKSLPDEVADYLCRLSQNDPDSLTCFIDDGEKFGLCGEEYLENLLAKLEEIVEFTTFSDYLYEHQPKGRIYLPSASYPEMIEWANGSFRNFLIKYQEANNMHKKMLSVSAQLHALRKGKVLIGDQEKDKRLKRAIELLYQGQGNDAYWHGSFTGLYSSNLRSSIYNRLIEAEKEIDLFRRGRRSFAEVSVTDFDKDGQDEAILANDFFSLYFSPTQGGGLFEFDYKPKAVNLINVLGRHSMMDHFLALDSELTAIREVGDFVCQPYLYFPKRTAGEVSLVMRREGHVDGSPVLLEKKVTLVPRQSIVNIEFKITNNGEQIDEFWFAPEFAFGVFDKTLKQRGEIKDVAELKIVDEWSKVNVLLESSKGALLWHYPIETRTESNGVPEVIYQGAALLLSWRARLAKGETWSVSLSLRIEE